MLNLRHCWDWDAESILMLYASECYFLLVLIGCDLNIVTLFESGTGRVPDQLVNLDMKHGVEAKNYEEVN